MIPLYVDLDGVLRDLEWFVFGKRVSDWMEPVGDSDEEFYSYVNKNLNILVDACPAKHFQVFYDFFNKTGHTLNILTHQPETWRKSAEDWVNTYLYGINYKLVFVNESKEKIDIIYRDGAVLIDDHPRLNGEVRVILFDKLYNKPIMDSQVRISKDDELLNVLEFLHDDNNSLKDWYHLAESVCV